MFRDRFISSILLTHVLLCLLGRLTTQNVSQIAISSRKDHEHAPERVLAQRMKSYIKHQRPSPNMWENASVPRQKTLAVEINLFVHSFSSISVVDMDYTVNIMLRQRWVDPRLRLGRNYVFDKLPISYMRDNLWIPDLFFRNAKKGHLHIMTTPNYLMWVNPMGVVTFSQKISMTLSCPMNLWTFPMDTQICKMNMGSYGYAKQDMDFFWWVNEVYSPVGTYAYPVNDNERAVTVNQDLQLNEFDLKKWYPKYCNMSYSTTGSFACIEALFILERKFGFYLIYAYFPSLLIVMIAWMSFFIDHQSVPARISIGLLCVLALMTQTAATLTQLPRVSYAKAIDLWLFVCLAFVVVSLLEFAIVNSMSRTKTQIQSSHSSKNLQVSDGESDITMAMTHEKLNNQPENRAIINLAKLLPLLAEGRSLGGEQTMILISPQAIFALLQANQKEASSSDLKKNKDDHLCDSEPLVNIEPEPRVVESLVGPDSALEQKDRPSKSFHSGRLSELRKQHPTSFGIEIIPHKMKSKNAEYQRRLRRITSSQLDHIFSLLFPFTFALFNICYWGYFLFWSSRTKAEVTEML